MARIETQYTSPNHSARAGNKVRCLVIHATAGSFHSSLSWLLNASSKVSAHYLISKAGRVVRLVDESRAAWHAGTSQWFDMDSADLQRESIGIELENSNSGIDSYPSPQMAALLELSRDIIARYHIIPDMVVRHSDIAIPRGRKSDPAGFPWTEYKKAIYATPVPTMPPVTARAYRVRGVPVYQSADRTGPLWGHLRQDETIVIDEPRNGHLADGRGFVRIDPDMLEAI